MNSSHEMRVTQSTDGAGILILLGTPIGNLSDLSERSIQTLVDADVIAAEDTRRLRVLLSHLNITGKQLLSIDANKEASAVSKVLEMVRAGRTVVYTTDAGMPGISDPGAKLVRAVSTAGLRLDAVPGPSAPILAASLSGYCEAGFVFAGFLSAKAGPRRKSLGELARSGFAAIVFESPNRIARLLEDARSVYGGDHPLFVGRELTKVHQELFYGTISVALGHFGASAQRGEFVVALGPGKRIDPSEEGLRILDGVVGVLGRDGGKMKAVADELSEITGVGRNQIYERLLVLRDNLGATS